MSNCYSEDRGSGRKMNRRRFLFGLGALIAAPAIIRPGILMPIKVIDLPPARYPGELFLPYRDLRFWVEEFESLARECRALRVVAHDQVDFDRLHRERTLAALA
jgi:hypothetical protein